MLLPTTKDSHNIIKSHKSHDEVNTYSHLIRHLTTDKDARKLTILLIINLICAVLEVIYGLISNSIGLLSDSAHMLFDSTALAVGIYASYKATLPANSKFSYGFDRFQTLSGLINGIFLIFIGFYIFIESLERIYNPPVIESRKMIVVAIIGLIVNVVGVTFFHEHAHFGEEDNHHGCSHGHSHKQEEKNHQHSHKSHAKAIGDHSHSHHAHSHSHSHNHHDHDSASSDSIPSTLNSIKEDEQHHHAGCNHSHSNQQPDHHHQHNCNHNEKSHDHELKHDHSHDHHEHDHAHDNDHDDHEHDHHHNENLYGVFLHILADLLGSVGVITSSVLIMLFNWHIADAICSAITSLLILASVVPLIKSSIMVFLQTYPAKYKKSFHQALSEISHHPAVVEFKDAHLWAYTQSKLVCSVVLVVKQSTVDTNNIIEFARKKLKTIKKIEYMTIDCRVEGQI